MAQIWKVTGGRYLSPHPRSPVSGTGPPDWHDRVRWVLHGVELVVWRLLGSAAINLGLVQPRVDPSFP